MKKFLKIIFFFFILLQATFAHPIDISSSFLSFSKNYLNITTYFHSYEIEYLLTKNNIKFKSVYEYYKHEDIIKNYIKQNIKLELEQNKCEIEKIEIMQLEEYQILSTWLEINYNFKCEKYIKNWIIKVSFFDNFPLQTNQMVFYDLNDNSTVPFETIVLTSKIQDYEFDLENKNKKCIVDSDWDGLSDEQELIHKTDSFLVDTDWDFYTDYEEIFYSWLALDKNMWPNQTLRTEIPKDILQKIKQNIKTKEDCEKQNFLTTKISKDTWLLSSWFWNEYFINTMKKLSDFINKISKENFLYIFLIIIWLWFIHAMWPGHSKSLLISYVLDKNKSFWDWFLYIIIFTLTHLIDIVLLFVITKVIFSFYDISNYMLYIQRFSLLIVLVFSLYLIFKSYKNLKPSSTSSYQVDNLCCEKKDFKWSILLWFVAWLAPCTFGWSIFLLLFSVWSFEFILPMILALWIWIFLCLLVILTLTYILRKKVFEKISLFSKYSSLISASILFVLSVYLMSFMY